MVGLVIWVGLIWLGVAVAVACGLCRWFRFLRDEP